MENISVLERRNISNKFTGEVFDSKTLPADNARVNPLLENILSEGGDDFFMYMKLTGLAKEPNLMVLSSMHHYYYDHDDLKGINTLINIKKLNQIKHLESFLHTLYRIMPSKAYFVGCFRNMNHKGKGILFYQSSKFLSGLMNIFDSRNERNISKKSAVKLLEGHGFKVLDVTDINGMSYFWAQNMRRSG
ncbi:MAG: hypothetical protein Q8868_03180 [Bacteroidota bacterium]|nr:hypothetical protein [Bacteroidota bacterium]